MTIETNKININYRLTNPSKHGTINSCEFDENVVFKTKQELIASL